MTVPGFHATNLLMENLGSIRQALQLFALLCGLTAASSHAKNPTYHYEPDIVELTGIVERQTFPGRPNYESIKDGDQIEAGRYLRLDRSIDVVRSPRDDNPNSETETEENVKILQLAWDSERNRELMDKKLIGKRVTLRGHLFHRWTAHHHSRVLMWVDEMKEMRK